MSGQPLYFGPVERRRFAVIHEPAEPRAAVLMCPPLGYEAVCAHAALRQLAERLAGHDITSMRMEYDGTGNSLGNDRDPDRVSSWIASIHDALDDLLARGYQRITLLGVRAGALLAGVAAQDRDEVRHLVLWDPLLSGRRYTRRVKMLAAGDTGGRDGDDVLVAGLRFADQTLSDLSRLRMPAPFPAASTLIVEPSDHPGDELGDRAGESGVTVLTLEGTSALLDTDAELSRVPHAILDQITEWLAREITPDEAPDELTPVESSTTALEQHGQQRIVHEAVRIGPGNLFATVTRPESGTPSRAVIMLNNGAAPQLGPGRAWVEWATELGREGWSAVRLDLTGLGDSPSLDDGTSRIFYPLHAGEDIREAVRYVREQGAGNVALLGLCSGALLSFDGLKATADIDAVACINARFDMPWFDPRKARKVRAAGRTVRPLAFALRKGKLFPLFDRVPRFFWLLLDRLRLSASPAHMLESTPGHRARILLLFGSEEWGLKALRRRSGHELTEALATDQYTLVEIPGMDHSMFGPGYRERAFEIVRLFLEENVANHAATATESTAQPLAQGDTASQR